MGPITVWINQNYALVLQVVVAFGGIFFAARTLDADNKARHAANYLTLVQMHYDIWTENRKRELGRVTDENVDTIKDPITHEEKEFLNIVFVHAHTTYKISKYGRNPFLPLKDLARGMRSLLELPLPRRVWNETREGRDPKFVKYVDKMLRN